MVYESVEALYEQKEKSLSAIEKALAGIRDARHGVRPATGEWSVQEILEHLAIVDGQIVGLIGKLIDRAEKTERAKSGFPVSLEGLATQIDKKIKTQSRFEPGGVQAEDVSLGIIRSAHRTMLGFRSRIDRIDVTAASFPHWAFGPLTLGQWIAFLAEHESRHATQMELRVMSEE